ncbi:MAG: TonB-dependent receptor [Bacteroidota bacterium]
MLKHFLFVLLFFRAFAASAQSDTIKTTLNEVIVSATRTETPYYSIASSVTIITREQITQRQHNSVVDLLREIPGLTIIQMGGTGKLSNVFLRGTNSNHTLVIVDGVELNDPSSPNNAFDFSFLSTYDIDRIEIIRGPQSTLYGSDALAGVISIFTKSGEPKKNHSFQTEGGSNNFFLANLSSSGTIGLMNYFFSLNRSGSDGISASNSKYGNIEKDGFSLNGFTSGIGINLNEFGKVNLSYKLTKAESDLDHSGKFGDDPNYIYKIEEQLFRLGYIKNFFNDTWETKLTASLMRRAGSAIDNYDTSRPMTYSDGYNKASRIKLDWQNNFRFINNNLLTLGIETEQEKANTSYYSQSEWGPYQSIFPESKAVSTGIYIQNQFNIASTLFTSAGLRLENHQKFGNELTYRIAPAYYSDQLNMKLKFTYGTGFKAPSLFNLFDPMWGNPDLKPEKSKGWDLGIEKYFMQNKLTAGVTYFDLRIENMFGFDNNYRTVNIARASTRGVELYFSIKQLNGFSVNTNYTFTETKDLFEGSEDFNKPLLRRPKQSASFNINYDNEKLNMNLGIYYVGEKEDKDFSTFPAERITMNDYYLINIAGSYKILDYLQITARIENLLNKDYEEVLYYGTLGRSYYAGLNLNF